MIYQDLELKTEHMRELKTHFIDCISQIGNVKVHGLTDEGSAPHIVSAGFAGVRSEVLLHTLEDRGICVSAGSACASNHPAISGENILIRRCGSVCRSLRQKKKLTIRWKHYIIVFRCFGNIHGADFT